MHNEERNERPRPSAEERALTWVLAAFVWIALAVLLWARFGDELGQMMDFSAEKPVPGEAPPVVDPPPPIPDPPPVVQQPPPIPDPPPIVEPPRSPIHRLRHLRSRGRLSSKSRSS